MRCTKKQDKINLNNLEKDSNWCSTKPQKNKILTTIMVKDNNQKIFQKVGEARSRRADFLEG